MNRRNFLLRGVVGAAIAGLAPSRILSAASQLAQPGSSGANPVYAPHIVKTLISRDIGAYMMYDANYAQRRNVRALELFRILIIGDSNASYDWNGPNSWPEHLFHAMLPNCPGLQLINAAQGGAAAGGERDFLQQGKQDILRQLGHADHTIVMLGTNNALKYAQSDKDFYFSWLTTVTLANSLCSAAYLTATSLPPMIYHPELGEGWVTSFEASLIPAYNAKIKQAVASSKFRQEMRKTRTTANFLNLPAAINNCMTGDGVHIDDQGDAVVGDFLVPTVLNSYRIAAAHAH